MSRFLNLSKTSTDSLTMKSSGGPRSSHCATAFFVGILLLAASAPMAAAQASPPPDAYNYARFSPSMAIIVVVLVAALFFMAFFSIYIRHCTRSDSGATVTAWHAATGRSRRRGLDQSVIDTFPTLEYTKVKHLKIGKGALECAVCLCEFEDDEMLRLIPKCDHVFHPDCIDAWLGSHTTCPVCRANLVPQPGDPAPQVLQLEGEADSAELVEIDLEQGEKRDEPDEPQAGPPEIKSLNRTQTRGSRSGRARRMFPRSHSTGHSLIQPGENTERFTLRLPAEVRKEIVNRQLNRAMSMVVLRREASSRRGYRTGGEGSNRGQLSRKLDRFARSFRSDRWNFNMVPNFFSKSGSLRSPRVAATADSGEGTSRRPAEAVPSSSGEAVQPPV